MNQRTLQQKGKDAVYAKGGYIKGNLSSVRLDDDELIIKLTPEDDGSYKIINPREPSKSFTISPKDYGMEDISDLFRKEMV